MIKKNLERARALIREDNTLDALFFLDKIIDHTDIPEVLSSYGLCIALERGKVKAGVDLCIRAIEKEPENVYHYLNLGKVYLKDNKKAVAIDIFRKGLKLDGDSESTVEICRILGWLGTRKRPVFPFLARGNVLNKYCGLFFSRLGLR